MKTKCIINIWHIYHHVFSFTSICLEYVCDCVVCMSLQTKVLTAIFSLPHGDFLSTWCSSELPVKEEDGSIEYDSFAAAGWVLDVFSSINPRNPPSLDFTAVSNNMSQASYAHQRTSLFVKVIANLHCFVPTICEGWFLAYQFAICHQLFGASEMYIDQTLFLHSQSRRGTFFLTSSWSACKWINLMSCLVLYIIRILPKLPLSAGICVIINSKNFSCGWNCRYYFLPHK